MNTSTEEEKNKAFAKAYMENAETNFANLVAIGWRGAEEAYVKSTGFDKTILWFLGIMVAGAIVFGIVFPPVS